ncbi:unnamed protein product [Brugia pahangi]|uniref:Uncharacterized protein n=1 Tax=Brugia pahangi TaxID=6280 RepID=A0A0N4TZV5_BRUPA|nr:unnamed protein product [Brugia pahangi]
MSLAISKITDSINYKKSSNLTTFGNDSSEIENKMSLAISKITDSINYKKSSNLTTFGNDSSEIENRKFRTICAGKNKIVQKI